MAPQTQHNNTTSRRRGRLTVKDSEPVPVRIRHPGVEPLLQRFQVRRQVRKLWDSSVEPLPLIDLRPETCGPSMTARGAAASSDLGPVQRKDAEIAFERGCDPGRHGPVERRADAVRLARPAESAVGLACGRVGAQRARAKGALIAVPPLRPNVPI